MYIILFIIFALSLSALVIATLAYIKKRKGVSSSIFDPTKSVGGCPHIRKDLNFVDQEEACMANNPPKGTTTCQIVTGFPNNYCCNQSMVDACNARTGNCNDICARTYTYGGDPTGITTCIASSQLIDTKTKGLIYLKDLKPGDYVHNGEYYDLVYFIQEHEGEFEVLNIHLGDDILKLTSEHLVYLDDKMICADSLNIGDLIQGKIIKNITNTVESVRNPVTISGKLLLGGLIVSCHNHNEEHAKKLQKLADYFDFEKLTEQIGSAMVQELVYTIYNKLANETFRKDRIMKPFTSNEGGQKVS